MIKLGKFARKAIASVLSVQIATLSILPTVTFAETMKEIKENAGIQDTNDPNLGGGQMGDGIGHNTGSDSLDDINNARCVDTRIISGRMITDTCWSCIFPIIALGVPFGGSKSEAPDDRVKSVLCMCKDSMGLPYPGYTYGMWLPSKLVELVRMPGCLATLGTTISFGKVGQGGWQNHTITPEKTVATVAHYHTYAFPVLVMLNMFEKSECIKDHYVDIDLLYLSELDPTWYDDTVSFFTNPEAVLLGNPISLLACAPDSISATALQKPINSLFWCAGAWGTMYPLSTHITGGGGEVKHSSLLTARLLTALHRRFFLKKTYTEEALCESTMAFFIPKTQYKITMMYPVPERDRAHVIGQNSLFWGANRNVPVTGEDFVYLIWTWNDCCMSMIQAAGY